MRAWVGLLLALVARAALAAPNVLNATTHGANNIAPAVIATAGSGVVDVSIFVDYDNTLSLTQLISDSTNGAAVLHSVASGLTVNHVPYPVMNYSESGYTTGKEDSIYASLEADSAMLTWPLALRVSGPLPAGSPPPTIVAGASSRESGNGGTGWGSEFAIEDSSCASSCTSTPGFLLTADSWLSAELAGFLATLQNAHGTFNLFDVKASLRQTAANWSTGYNHLNYGYGTVSWPSANAIASTSSLFLQPPGMAALNGGYLAKITLYPYRQTRRTNEVVYSCTSGYSWPVKNEYTLADVTAGCGTLLYTSNGTDVTPTFTYAPAVSGTVTFIAFTTDGSGNYSREEEFSPMALTFVVGSICH